MVSTVARSAKEDRKPTLSPLTREGCRAVASQRDGKALLSLRLASPDRIHPTAFAELPPLQR
jgi:hypothetical protein